MPSKTFTIKIFEISSFNDFLQAIIKDRTILKYKNTLGYDAYLLASWNKHLEIMKYLEKEHNWDIHVKNEDGDDAYLLASQNGQLEIMKYLEEEHNWDIHVKNEDGNDAYFLASLYQHNEILKYLNELYEKEREVETGNNEVIGTSYEEVETPNNKEIESSNEEVENNVGTNNIILKLKEKMSQKDEKIKSIEAELKTFKEQVLKLLS